MWVRLPNTRCKFWTKFCVEIKFGRRPLKVGTVANAVHLVRGDHCRHWAMCNCTVDHCGHSDQCGPLWTIVGSPLCTVGFFDQSNGHHDHWSASISFIFSKISPPFKTFIHPSATELLDRVPKFLRWGRGTWLDELTFCHKITFYHQITFYHKIVFFSWSWWWLVVCGKIPTEKSSIGINWHHCSVS